MIIILLTIYIVSTYIWYILIQRLHDPVKGMWCNIKPTTTDIVIMFTPVVNTVWGILVFIYSFAGKETTFFDKK